MKNLLSFTEWVVESISYFKNKSTVDSYSDVRDFWRNLLGEDNEDNQKLQIKAFDTAKIYKIDIDKIIPNQDYIDNNTVQKYSNAESIDLPKGIKFKNGYVVVFDGHHRIIAQILSGKKIINMKILKANF